MRQDHHIYAIYNADGSIQGELSYLAGKVTGQRECALCDISHGLNPIGKPAWRRSQKTQPKVEWIHRDEQPEALAQFTAGKLPMVALVSAGVSTTLLDREALQSCQGDLATFERLLEERLSQFLAGSDNVRD